MAVCKRPFGDYGCGQCMPCRLNFRRKKVIRVLLEQTQHEMSSFLTLTYDPAHAHRNSDGLFVLVYSDLQKFWKRMRDHGYKPRYMAVGEYGHDGDGFIDASGEQWNPHFHAALFGIACEGKIYRPDSGPRCFCSTCEDIREIWGKGNITLDELNETTANYIAGYVMKKLTAPDDFRLSGRPPERPFYSLKPGLGSDAMMVMASALEPYRQRALADGDVPYEIVYGGKKVPLDRYLRVLLRREWGLEKINLETGEVTYGTPSEVLYRLSEKKNLEVRDLLLRAKKATSSEEVEKILESPRAVRLQKVKNIENRHNVYKQRKKL